MNHIKKLRELPVLEGTFERIDFNYIPDNPQELFIKWLNEAIQNKCRNPHAMTVSTISEDGFPDARILILKNIDNRGWHFAIKSNSRKGRQIIKNKAVTLSFYWSSMERQVKIIGEANEIKNSESRTDFQERSKESKIASIASKQSEILHSEFELNEKIKYAKKLLETDYNYVPDEWKVFAVKPISVEFWQGHQNRLHDRVKYISLDNDNWKKNRLWP
ncbi:pyridoxamine 5'-phosphate oxidase [Arsenophonus nasoniae]|uniref:Pyridoxamine 5'-phosphate oxidase n=1 Tax=Arsenophonus nasoniae TaxID=638 RepID=A0AA95KFB1_9GAMM|nr:pyridoxamine 5'-phosphate oxidase [Arsenophonus nasoniae]WGM04088.1 pyridoxamine 5'-phosphate oxidase [Arsenophonus nasoniae]